MSDLNLLKYIEECSGNKTLQNILCCSRIPKPKLTLRPVFDHISSPHTFNGWEIEIKSMLPDYTHELLIKIPSNTSKLISATEREEKIVTTKHQLSSE
jgi:hypothetical protein